MAPLREDIYHLSLICIEKQYSTSKDFTKYLRRRKLLLRVLGHLTIAKRRKSLCSTHRYCIKTALQYRQDGQHNLSVKCQHIASLIVNRSEYNEN